MGLPIGIDLGTTFSCVAVFKAGKVEIIPNEQGNRTTPSWIAFTESERLIGDGAKSASRMFPTNTIFDVKRIIGRKYDDPLLQTNMLKFPFTILNRNEQPKIQVEYKSKLILFSPEELSAMVLTYLKHTAENYLGERVTSAVITVPAYFSDSQRQATHDAGKIAGLKVLSIINEPTAAAIAYGLEEKPAGEINILVFDFGGGTFDVSILTVQEGRTFKVIATAGDTNLGGEDINDRLVDHFLERFKLKSKKDASSSPTAMHRLREACERAKRILSATNETTLDLESFFSGHDLSFSITRARFNSLCADLFNKTIEIVERALKDAEMNKGSIDDIVMIGGSSRIPQVQKLVKEFFDWKQLTMSINPDESVAYGAAVQAAILGGSRNDEIADIVLCDVTPLSLGIDTTGGIMSNVIARNSPIPCKKSRIFTTARDNQTEATITVFEGERTSTKDNTLLGHFTLSGLRKALRHEVKIQVQLIVNTNGILTVTALDKESGKSEGINIENMKGRLSPEEIKRMVAEAKKYEKEDKERLIAFSARRALENFLYNTKMRMHYGHNSLTSEDKRKLDNFCKNEIDWVDRNVFAEKEEYDLKMEDAKDYLTPFMSKLNLR